MNITISSNRRIEYIDAKGKRRTCDQYQAFNAKQTPTKVSHEIMAASDRLGAYMEWVISSSSTEIVPVYAPDDYMCQYPIGTQLYNWGEEHVRELKEWVRDVLESGYIVEVSIG